MAQGKGLSRTVLEPMPPGIAPPSIPEGNVLRVPRNTLRE
jgi:hypothetical protein